MTYSGTTLQTTLGTIGATPVVATHYANAFVDAPLQTIVLTSDYLRVAPPGWVITPAGAASGTSTYPNPATIASGSTIVVSKPEADAIVAAGGA